MNSVALHSNSRRLRPGTGTALEPFSAHEAARARNFHKSFKEYAPTPLHSLPALAAHMGVGGLHIKDESLRFGLNAFKVLGASYAVGRILAEKLHCPIENLGREALCADALRAQLGDITFATATDGNHGRGLAWTVQQLRQRAVVYMPKGSDPIRAENIRATGAECTITDLNYDDAVRLANKKSLENGWLMVQDTAWEGYEDIPRWIMQGYMTLTVEALEQLQSRGVSAPSHVFLQAGVGSFAGATLGFLACALGDAWPITTIVEPHQANCLYTSMMASDGKPHNTPGTLDTLMAGLACGEPCTTSWGILRDYASAAISCPDYIAANGMRILSSPLRGDPRIISGESGAVTCGILDYIARRPEGAHIRRVLNLDTSSQVLLISTEGDTSPKTFRDIIWHGNYAEEKQ